MRTFSCGRCHQKSNPTGSGIRFVLGMRRRVCGLCASFIDRAKGKK